MKIYTSEPVYELDPFIGADVWVRFQRVMNSGTEYEWITTPSYIRVLAKDYDNVHDEYCYSYNAIHGKYLDDPEEYPFVADANYMFTHCYSTPCSAFILCEPIDIIAHEDMKTILGDRNETLH